VTAWLNQARDSGEIVPVLVESTDGTAPRKAFALADYQKRLQCLPNVPDYARLLSPFDPILRDRARCKRLFNLRRAVET